MICYNNIYRGRRVLVTGHTGFKGSWLALWLQTMGAEVAGFSLEVGPSAPSHFVLLGLGKHIRHYVGDIRDQNRLAAVFDDFRPEVVFHLAAQALVRRSYMDPALTFETNIMGMVNVLECIRIRPWIEVAVLITSDKAYRNDEWCWGYRETDVLAGHDPYSSSKSCADLVAQSYFQSFLKECPTRIAIARAGNVIGGGDWADDRIVPDCVRAWSARRPAEVRSPHSTRPWQHVLEPLSGYLALGARLWQRPEGVNGEAFNFGPDASVNQTVAVLLQAMVDRWPDVHWQVAQGCENFGREAKLLKLSSEKAAFHLQWRATLQFLETVALTIDWYRAWAEDRSDLCELSTGQINDYCRLANQRGLPWVQV